MTPEFGHTATNMVNHVNTIINSYQMGAIRALAQEPVQNSKDAGRGNPFVEYKLLTREDSNGQEMWMLTVTDWNTSGLQGPIFTLDQIENRGRLGRDENWAAFEGMNYTREHEDALGSRGQGKAAFLYYSKLPPLGTLPRERMMILYDTLLANGEYRLGVRYATPSDLVRTPPFTGDAARQTVSSSYAASDGTRIDLGLEPLTQVGTRVIVPYLSPEAVKAFHSGELYNWLQRCWWRAVQTGLTIHLVDELGSSRTVAPPAWWVGEPWQRSSSNMRLCENMGQDDARIKRMVLRYDETVDNNDTEGYDPQFCGVQLLRGQQWIETLPFHDDVPRDKRPGFHGFVEFDLMTERLLRKAESSQHDRFDKRVAPCNVLIPLIAQKVREFAQEMGWSRPQHIQAAPDRERDAAMEFLRFFNPRARRQSPTTRGSNQSTMWDRNTEPAPDWSCDLRMEFPDGHIARADWGSYIRNVSVDVRVAPAGNRRPPTVHLSLASDTNPSMRLPIAQREVDLWEGAGTTPFGDFEVIRGNSNAQHLSCTASGKWKLSAEVNAAGTVVAKDARSFYVQEDPPQPSPKPYTISISAENHTTQRRRIESGDELNIQISVKNRQAGDARFEVDATLGDELLADGVIVPAPGTPPGATPRRIAALQESIEIITPEATPSSRFRSVNLPAGRHQIRADLKLDGEVVAHAVKTIDVEVDPIRNEDWIPFNVEQRSEGVYPRYEFKIDGERWTLQFPNEYPLYRFLSTQPGSASGGEAFVVDVCAEGLVEWATFGTDDGDESRLEELLAWELPEGVDQLKWERFDEKLRDLPDMIRRGEAWPDIGKRQRECAALLLAIFGERG